jgi:hypothetical protein
MGTTVESSSVGSMMTELATSAVGGAVGCAALVVATLALCGAGGAAVVVGGSGGAGGVLPVSVLGAGGVAVVSPVTAAVGSDPAAAPSLLRGASVAVDVSDDVAHAPDVVGAVAVPPSVVLADGATASVAPAMHELSVAAGDVAVDMSDDVAHAPDVVGAVAVPTTVVLPDGATASVTPIVHEVSVAAGDVAVAVSVLTAVVVLSVEDDDGSVDEIEPAVSGSVAVTSEGVSDAPAVVSDICVLPVTSAVVVGVFMSAGAGVVSAEGTAVSTAWSGGAGTSPALAGATQVDVEATPTIKTAVQRITRSSRRRCQSFRCNEATLRMLPCIDSVLVPTTSTPSSSMRSYTPGNKAGTRPSERNSPLVAPTRAR